MRKRNFYSGHILVHSWHSRGQGWEAHAVDTQTHEAITFMVPDALFEALGDGPEPSYFIEGCRKLDEAKPTVDDEWNFTSEVELRLIEDSEAGITHILSVQSQTGI